MCRCCFNALTVAQLFAGRARHPACEATHQFSNQCHMKTFCNPEFWSCNAELAYPSYCKDSIPSATPTESGALYPSPIDSQLSTTDIDEVPSGKWSDNASIKTEQEEMVVVNQKRAAKTKTKRPRRRPAVAQQNHQEQKPATFRCNDSKCPYRSNSKANRNRHIIRVHKPPKLFICPFESCSKRVFKRLDNCQKHIKGVHRRETLENNTVPEVLIISKVS